MWHKLKDIFGYNDSKITQTESIADKGEEKSDQNVSRIAADQSNINILKENSSVTEPVNSVTNQTMSKLDDKQTFWNLNTYLNNFDKIKAQHEICFSCKVTASLTTLGMVVLFGVRSVFIRRELPQVKHKFLYSANISLFGMWVAFMKSEWYDEKETPDTQKENSR